MYTKTLGYAKEGGSDAIRDANTIKKPGQRGSKKLLAQYGVRLVCVRYRYDEQKKRRFKTVELIVEEVDWKPKARHEAGDTMVGLRIDWREMELRSKVKQAGGEMESQEARMGDAL